MAKKNNKNKEKYKKLKNNHLWVTALFCLIVLFIVIVFMSLFSSLFVTYMVDSKITDEYKAVSYMATIYDAASNPDEIYPLLDKEGRTYYIADKHGTVIYQNGENTMGSTSGTVSITNFRGLIDADSDDVTVYVDKTTEEFLIKKDNGRIAVDYLYLLKFVNHIKDNSSIKIDFDKSTVELPIWISIDVKNHTQVFYGKTGFIITFADIYLVVILFMAAVILTICIFVLTIYNLISNLKAQAKINKVFNTDPITGGKSWMWFSEKAEDILKRKKKVNFAVLDVVIVKYRNFCVCHSVHEGEMLLKEINRKLKSFKGKDELVAHYASANYAMFLKYDTDENLSERILKMIEDLEGSVGDHRITFHVGVYPLPALKNEKGKFVKRKEIDIERDYNNACTARSTLEEKDESGMAFFDENLVKEQKWVDEVLDKFKDAIEKEEFIVYYQPKYNPKTNELKGAEALIRWQYSEDEIKAPGAFIPILEKNGYITDIDHYMITHVARDQKAWLDAGHKCVPVSVNVSRAHFIEKDLAVQLRDAVDKEGAPHELIEIELTESAFFDDKKAMISTIKELKSYGFQVSMDDFGSGYSSLNSLKDMPLDVLKLDAEFFRGDETEDRGERVVRKAIELAQSLEMLTVAEGVEEKSQVEFLANLGCDMIQGYFYAHPMPKTEYEKKMA